MKTREVQKVPANESADIPGLDNKKTIAQVTRVSTRTIDTWMRNKRIPFLRLSSRCIRFNRDAVLRALQRFEVKAVTR